MLEEDLGLWHHLNGLLESTGAQLKEDLALLVR